MNTKTNRRGKIARLPLDIRTQVNQRLADNQPAGIILEWLHQLGPVRKVLAEQFGGAPVSPQNLSQWRKRGFLEWQRQRDTDALVAQLSETQDQVEPDTCKHPLTECLATAMVLELAKVVRVLEDDELDRKAHWQRLRPLLRELDRLRRGEHQAARLRLDRARQETREARRMRRDQALCPTPDERQKSASKTTAGTAPGAARPKTAAQPHTLSVPVDSNCWCANDCDTTGSPNTVIDRGGPSKPIKADQS